MKETRILVADGMPVFRGAVGNMLAHEDDFDVREAGSLDEVLAAIETRCVDVALSRPSAPSGSGATTR